MKETVEFVHEVSPGYFAGRNGVTRDIEEASRALTPGVFCDHVSRLAPNRGRIIKVVVETRVYQG